jgi:alkanesulfonate monooxygenase SsuD/methylene tetrahydromethanopterin reductase-like flavin-dependent oxidoreductase (luciferase family)
VRNASGAKRPSRRRFKVGVFLPITEREMGGRSPRWGDILAIARRAEELDFDSVWVEDHLTFSFDGQEPQGVWECWSLLAALAATTSRLEIGPLVSCASFRNPALLAKMADTVDEIAGGRLILGLGAGWHEPEYRSYGYPFDRRVSRFEEALTIIHGLLRTGRVDFTGEFHSARDCELRPRGPRPEGPPIMIGSTSPRMLGLIAAYGDQWNAWAVQSLEEYERQRVLVDAAMEQRGRDPASLKRTVCVLVDTPMRRGRPSEPREATRFETPGALADFLDALAGAGVSHVQLWTDPNDLAGLEWVASALPLVTRGER